MEEETKALTNDEIEYVIKFAQGLTSMFPNVYNPLLTNAQMQNLTLNPMLPTEDNITAALNSPKTSEDTLIAYGEHFEITDMLYKRLVLYLANMLSFDLDWVSTNATESDYSSAAYKKDKDIMISFLDKFDVKDEFTKVMKQLIRQEAFFGQVRFDYQDKITIQELPEKYSLITGRFPYGLLFDFNMNYFLNAGISLDMFSPTFKEYYYRIFGENNTPDYNPAAKFNERDGSWTYYVQTSPADGFWCFKLFPELATRIPMFAPLYPEIVLRPLFVKLSTNANIQAATKILLGSVPFLKSDVKGSVVKDSFAISADNLGKFLYLLRSGINEVISLGAAPLDNMATHEFNMPARSILGEYSQVTASASGVNSRLIYGYDKQSVEETRNSISVDEYMITPIYREFENFLNYYINKRTKKFKFKFMLSGTEFDTARRKKIEDAVSLANIGMVIPGKFAAAMGVKKQDLERLMAESKSESWVDKFTPILQSAQMPAEKSSGNGRPKKSDGDLSETGAYTRESGKNIENGGNL